MPRLFLLDGTALAYRSHYALARSGLTAPDGRPTGATYGFTMTLRRILEQESPDAIAVAFDPRGPTLNTGRGRGIIRRERCQMTTDPKRIAVGVGSLPLIAVGPGIAVPAKGVRARH